MGLGSIFRQVLNTEQYAGLVQAYLRTGRFVAGTPILRWISTQLIERGFAARGYYRFRFEFFDAWARLRWERYFYWQLANHGDNPRIRMLRASVDEYETLKPIIAQVFGSTAPRKAMDFACGMGRSTVFFRNMFGWKDTQYVMVDGQKSVFGPKSFMGEAQDHFHKQVKRIFDEAESYYTDFDLLDRFLSSNHFSTHHIVDSSTQRRELSRIRDVELLYSFHAVGYHWDIANTIRYYDLGSAVAPGGLAIFGLRKRADPLFELDLESVLELGFEKVAILDGNLLQQFLVLRKQP